ncbi:cytidine deaminase [Algivirga pacifica]|uniref:Cytidine deaminase n=1 Tax=Algivirga pacifica TaxID=1162670 RepID=A0ABP9DIM4_9BACT
MPEKINYTIQLERYTSLEELPKDYQQLVIKAREASRNAYAPYSSFYVGAAVQLETGEIILGNNQENAAYPSGMCAERSAMYWIGGNRPGQKIKAIAVVANNQQKHEFVAISPCGACRQALLEYEHKQEQAIAMIMETENHGFLVVDSIRSLLPVTFDQESLLGDE